MYRTKSYLSLSLAFAGLLFIVLSGAKCKNDCDDIICDPCPSSRFRIEYVDSTGQCDPAFYANAMIHCINTNSGDTLYSYNLSSDSCMATFIIQEDVVYHVVSDVPAFRDTILIGDWEFQPGVEVSECCMCYPVEHADIWINGDSSHVEFPDSLFLNEPVVRPIN